MDLLHCSDLQQCLANWHFRVLLSSISTTGGLRENQMARAQRTGLHWDYTLFGWLDYLVDWSHMGRSHGTSMERCFSVGTPHHRRSRLLRRVCVRLHSSQESRIPIVSVSEMDGL